MSSSDGHHENAPAVSALLRTLADRYRREVIYYFEEFTADGTASLETLVTHIDDRIHSAEQGELRVSLHHTHLPALAEGGWLEYDSRANDIRYYGHRHSEELLKELVTVFED